MIVANETDNLKLKYTSLCYLISQFKKPIHQCTQGLAFTFLVALFSFFFFSAFLFSDLTFVVFKFSQHLHAQNSYSTHMYLHQCVLHLRIQRFFTHPLFPAHEVHIGVIVFDDVYLYVHIQLNTLFCPKKVQSTEKSQTIIQHPFLADMILVEGCC